MKGFTSRKIELFYRLFHPFKKTTASQQPKRILICNWGGLGDVYLSSFMIQPLRERFPGCEIGMLTTPQSKVAVKGVDFHHLHPYWFRLNEKKGLLYLRFLKYFFLRKRRIARELSQKRYDLAIVANPYFSGLAHMVYDAKIPRRIGFETIGDRKFLTDITPWQGNEYLLDHYKRLLEQLGSRDFPSAQSEVVEERPQKILFHLFSADARKDLPLSFWIELHSYFKESGYEVYFTGRGEGQRREIAKIATDAYNLCDRHEWEGFVEEIQSSSLLISVDTVAVHLAAAFNRPFLAIYRNTPQVGLWFPKSDQGKALHWPVSPKEVFLEVECESRC